MSNFPVIAYTCGEPAGIGPDLALALAAQALPCRLRVLGNFDVLSARAEQLGLSVQFVELRAADATPEHTPGKLAVQSFVLATPVAAGKLDARNGAHVLALLDAALLGCMNGDYAAMVTGPVHKGIINEAGIPFTGHTEYLAEKSGTEKVVMMLTGGGLRVALATTHLPLKDVPAAITRESLEQVLRILHRELVEKFGIASPHIAVCGLNPHAGESGHLGREEIDVIDPVLARLRAQGMKLSGPLPADTLFAQLRKQPADAVLAMYHDQGLPVLKYASFGEGINVTLGLPFIRTSVDHGTALELAGTGQAETGSLLAAIELAIELATSRIKP
ncbi:MAG: 4-hydroxythreonine-4-phosphate dehydrogenase PdxA [Pseudomonadota bacterium]